MGPVKFDRAKFYCSRMRMYVIYEQTGLKLLNSRSVSFMNEFSFSLRLKNSCGRLTKVSNVVVSDFYMGIAFIVKTKG